MNENGFGLEREIDAEGENKHIETQKLKNMTLAKDTNSLQSHLKSLKSEINMINDIMIGLSKIESLEGKEGLLNKSKVTIDRNEFENLKNTAKKYLISDIEIKELNFILEKELSNLKKENKKMFDFIVQEDKLDDFIKDGKRHLLSKEKLKKHIKNRKVFI